MSVGYNLIRCGLEGRDTPSYRNIDPSLDLQPYVGQVVKINNSDYFTVTRNNQAFMSFGHSPSDTIRITVSSFKHNGIELVATPLVLTYNVAGLVEVAFLGLHTYPYTLPTDYTSAQINATYGTPAPGSTIDTNFATFLQGILSGAFVSGVLVRRSHPTFVDIPSTVPSERFNNLVFQKRDTDSIELTYNMTNYVAATLVEFANVDYVFNFTGSIATLTENGVPRIEFSLPITAYVTNEKPLYLSPYTINTIVVQDGCPSNDCYKLVNCEDGETISTSVDLSASVGKIVTLEDFDGCWEVFDCDTKIPVVKIDEFVSCKGCLPNKC